MSALLPRIFYLLAAFAILLLLWPNPVTLFMAACFSCLTLPIYRRQLCRAKLRIRQLERHWPQGFRRRFCTACLRQQPMYGYIIFIISTLVIPVGTLVLLVSPQAAAGLARLRELRENNFQLPEHWQQSIREMLDTLPDIPSIEQSFNDLVKNLDSMASDAVGMLVSHSFDVLGGTMNVLWTTFLFLTLTVIFTAYARPIRIMAGRLFQMPQQQLHRFIHAIYRALRAIMLGVVLVALAQGFLCGIGFAVAGVNQPAFWGMLAALVAPIPMVGTALVWLPLCISLWFTGKTMAAVGLGLWGMLAVTSVDNVLRPLFLRQGIDAPFFVLILAILCGLASFGPVGLIAGPVLLAFAIQARKEADHIYPMP